MLEIVVVRFIFVLGGLKKADRYKIQDIDILQMRDYINKKPFENDYKIIYDINFTELSSAELLFLQNNIIDL